ncbi:MAG: undecaprenyl-phosphate glucose phosphotransferase [Hyphomicrobium sp.]
MATRPKRRLSRVVAADVVAIGDFLAIVIGGMLPALIYGTAGQVEMEHLTVLQSTVIAGFLTHLVLRLRGMYQTSHMAAFPYAPLELLLGVTCGLVGVLGIGLPLTLRNVHLVFWYTAWISASMTLILLNRLVARHVLARFARLGRFDQRIAVYGAGGIARRVRDYLCEPDLGIYFKGVYDDRADQNRVNPEGLVVSGKLDDLVARCREGRVDRIIIALPPTADARLGDIIEKFDNLPVSTHIVTHIASDLVTTDAGYHVSSLGPIGLLDVKKKPLIDWAPVSKRLEDLLLSSLILAATLPFWPLIAIAIKLDSPGPVLFRQRRRGRYQTVVEILKFRTMCVIEDGDAARQAIPGDARITRVGRILRRTSLDELPQLFNVISGEMSLVGPRPHALVHDDEFTRLLKLYPDRHQMKPGMTGLAQVSGLRGPTSMPGAIEARVQADLDYVLKWSLWLDLKILMRTLGAVIRGENAG